MSYDEFREWVCESNKYSVLPLSAAQIAAVFPSRPTMLTSAPFSMSSTAILSNSEKWNVVLSRHILVIPNYSEQESGFFLSPKK